MKRSTLTAFVLGAVLATAAFYAGQSTAPKEATADVPLTVVGKGYTPSFGEWVDVWLKLHFDVELAHDYHIRSGGHQTERGWKYTTTAAYTKATKALCLRVLNTQRLILMYQIERWKKQGYDISIDDFEIREGFRSQ